MADDQTPPTTTNLVIPADTQDRFADLIELIKTSESMNDEERQYWINILPIMTPDQIQNLREILENERTQLAAIDARYASEMQKMGQPELVKTIDEERRKRREERSKQEQSAQQEDDEHTENLLNEIEGV